MHVDGLRLERVQQRADVASRPRPRKRQRRHVDPDSQGRHAASLGTEGGQYPPGVAVDTAARAPLLPRLGVLPRYGDLLLTLIRRELRVKYKGSALGLFWSLIYPLAMVGVYTLVFSLLWQVTGNIPHYPLFVLSGLAVWGFFQAGIQHGTTRWSQRRADQEGLVPARAGAGLGRARPDGDDRVMLCDPDPGRPDRRAGQRAHGRARRPDRRRPDLPRPRAWPGCSRSRTSSTATSSTCSRSVFLPWFFLTPVLYGLDQFSVASGHRWLILLMRYGNPVTPYVESVRAVVLQHVVPGAPLLLYVFIVGPLVALLGLWVMQRYEDRVAIEL